MHVFLLGFAEQGSMAGMLIRKQFISSRGTYSLNAAPTRYLWGSVPAFSGRKPKMGITAQQGQSKNWNLGWSPVLYPILIYCSLPWWKWEALVPIPPWHCLEAVAGRCQQGVCSNAFICELKILPTWKCLVSGLVYAPMPDLRKVQFHASVGLNFSWGFCRKRYFKATVLGSALHICLYIHLYVRTPTHTCWARLCFPRAAFAVNFARFFWCFTCPASGFRGMRHLGQSHRKVISRSWGAFGSPCCHLCYCVVLLRYALIQKLNPDCTRLPHTIWPWWERVAE